MNKKICVVGGGYWGKNHIKTLYNLDSLGGIVDPSEEILNTHKKIYNDINYYSSLDDALNEKEFSGFIVATPAHTHFEVAKKIILRKNHVLIEKPFTLNIEDAEELSFLGKKNKVKIMVGHVLLFHPAIQKIKKLIDSKKIGDLRYIYSNRLNFGKVRTKENVLWSLGPHDVALMQYLTSSSPSKISASGAILLQEKIHDKVVINLKYLNGIECHIFLSWINPFKEHRLVLIGSKGMLVYEDSSIDKNLKFYPMRFEFNQGSIHSFDGEEQIINYQSGMPLTLELEYFLKCINEDEDFDIANTEHALDVTRVLIDADKQIR